MRVFLFEFVTGGGFRSLDNQPMPEGTLLVEGEAMWRAIHDDLVDAGAEVVSLRDSRLPQLDVAGITPVDHFFGENFFGACANSDCCLLIAPEFDGIAVRMTERAEMIGARLLSPDSNFVRIAADKSATVKRLADHEIPTPPGLRLDAYEKLPADFAYPAVAKVNDGAGSMVEVIAKPTDRTFPGVTRLEQLVNGIACSISFLCQGSEEPIACPPMRQILSGDGKFSYLGGQRIMQPALIDRATSLGKRVLRAFPPTVGYVGIDLMLADGESPRSDVVDYVIEVNPRLTTSYIGLREIAETNLAKLMLSAVCSESSKAAADVAKFSNFDVSFQSDGKVN